MNSLHYRGVPELPKHPTTWSIYDDLYDDEVYDWRDHYNDEHQNIIIVSVIDDEYVFSEVKGFEYFDDIITDINIEDDLPYGELVYCNNALKKLEYDFPEIAV